ncbi:hypothetical protein E2C01_078617 [Portunus trituberculatus]|uniref:Uncharacterized protein n=1 Tax=Portunus trituberculatus TaxID=210409 RepID=A0A5B7IQM9_PORTR|nr:hypothetical protein [Portunus trituberculatus]
MFQLPQWLFHNGSSPEIIHDSRLIRRYYFDHGGVLVTGLVRSDTERIYPLKVQYQNLVNELIKNIIIFSEDIFPGDGGHVYEKYISRDSIDLEVEACDAPSENPDEVDSEPGQSEDGECLSNQCSWLSFVT